MTSPHVPDVAADRRALWPEGAATGVGSLPGTDVRDAVRLVVDTLPDLPHVPELPARGPGADMVGRTLAMLPGLAGEWSSSGWVLASRPGHDARHAAALLGEDLDTVEEELAGWRGVLKQQMCGPWTLAASIELRSGRKVLSDVGAVRDLGQAFAEAAAEQVADLGRRVPGARVLLQVDEPWLPTVLAAGVPTPSGLATLRVPERTVVEQVLRSAVESVAPGAATAVHCCGSAPPVALFRAAGFAALSLDAGVLTPADDDAVAEAVDDGAHLMLGADGSSAAAVAATVREKWRRTGRPAAEVTGVAITPPCGLAGSTPPDARAALERSQEAARILGDDPEGDSG